MRIGLDLRMGGTEYGIGRYAFELVQRILQEDRANDYIIFVRDKTKFVNAGFDLQSNVKLVKADFRHYSWSEQFLFPRVIKRENLDLVHFMNFNVPLFYNAPFVVTIHDMVHHKLPGNKKRRFLHRLAYKLVIRHAARAAKKIITVSNASRNDIAKQYNIAPNKIEVVYEAASVVPVSDSDIASVQQKFGINKPFIIFVGVMERKKNIAVLAEAFDVLKGHFQDNVQLVLAGKQDPHYPEVVEMAARIKYRKDLVFTGVITDKEKYALYKGAVAFVSASLYEGFGLPGVEAMSVGKPLAVANTEVFNEIYDNGAIYFDGRDPRDIAEKIHLLLSDDKYRELIANNAFTRAQFFSWEQAAKETISVYNSIV